MLTIFEWVSIKIAKFTLIEGYPILNLVNFKYHMQWISYYYKSEDTIETHINPHETW